MRIAVWKFQRHQIERMVKMDKIIMLAELIGIELTHKDIINYSRDRPLISFDDALDRLERQAHEASISFMQAIEGREE